jgi:hypothetical protein
VLEAADPRFEKGASRRFLEELGGSHITEIYQDPEPEPHPARPEAKGHA